MFLLRETATSNAPPKTVDAAVELATGLLNTVHIPQGAVAKISKTDGFEWTNWACIKIPSSKTFLLRTYGDMQWRRIRLTGLDFTREDYPEIPLYVEGLGITDITPK